jgi:TonB family protein
MSRLRVRLELNRRSAGVPLEKLASVVEETRRFFHLLAEDVHMDAEHGEWVASDFDPESLNFTAEYSGAVTAEQVHAFGAAFAGATSLRRSTIAQFTRIADFLGEDELVGFGLFQSDLETEPSEWRCLSKRDAQRFGQEIRMLAQAVGDSQPETSLPTVMNGSVAGRRLFKDRRGRESLAGDPAKLIREVEANLSRRIDLLEGQVETHDRKINESRQIGVRAQDISDERFGRLLAAMEQFWAQTPRQVPQLAAPQAPAASMLVSEPPVEPAKPETPSPAPEPAPRSMEAAVDTAPAASTALPEKADLVEKPVLAEPPASAEAAVPSEKPVLSQQPAAALEELPLTVPPARKFGRWWLYGSMAAAAIALSFAIPEMQHDLSLYTTEEKMPVVHPKAPAAPPLPVAKIVDAKPEQAEVVKAAGPKVPAAKPGELKPNEAKAKSSDNKTADRKTAKHSQPFEGPQIALQIPAGIRPKAPVDARVQVIVAIDEQGNVTRAEVASTKGRGARLLEKEALAAARRARFRPAREGDRPVESQMILTYFFKPESAEF